MPDLAAAEAFVWTDARLLDRHRFAHRWLDGPPDPVLAALAAYETPDGGYGHALEPDLRAPLASPGAVETALRVLAEVGALDGPLGRRAVDWLAGVAPDGPLDFSPRPGSRSRALFDAALVDAHLDHLAGAQRDDGGWTFNWPAWSQAAGADWRGIVTLHALELLAIHGRL